MTLGMIPKILTLYWGGNLSYLRYLTILSFKKLNPQWHINVFYPAFPTSNVSWKTGEQSGSYLGANYFPMLEEFADLIPFSMESIGFSDLMPEVHKSGVVRAWALSEYGGLYSDMDILYVKPFKIDPVFNLIISYDEVNTSFSDGFIGCSIQGKSFFKNFLDSFYKFKLTNINKEMGYQALGPSVWNNLVQKSNYPPDVWNIPMSLVYHYDSFHIDDIFSENSNDLNTLFPEESIGCHWYGGHPATRYWENMITPENYKFNNIISKLVQNILSNV